MTPTERAAEYVDEVLAGKIPANRYVKLACKRFLRDLKKAKRRNYPYEYVAEKADRAVNFMELMPHVKGRWAALDMLLEFRGFECFIECNIFGWVYKKTGFRRFRESYEEIPRKNGKSTRVAARGLYMLCADGESGSEVYSGATTEKQAHEVFKPAWMMVNKLPDLRSDLGIDQGGTAQNPGSIYREQDMSKFQTLIGKPGDGASPHCALIDEYHEHETDHMVDTMQTGMGAREQPLLSIITTAGANLGGPCYQKRAELIQILEGTIESERTFGILFGIDTQYDKIYQSSQAIEVIGKICNCKRVNVEQTALLFAKENVQAATTKTIESSENYCQQDAKTIQTGPLPAKAFAEAATTEYSKRKHQSTEPDKLCDLLNGQSETQTEYVSTKKNGRGNSRKKNSTGADVTPSSKLIMELESLSTILCTTKSKGNAGYARTISKLYALITATPPEELEDCFAKSATLESVFSETLQKAYEKHLTTCAVRELKLNKGEVVETVPEDKWEDPESLKKANPNYGVSVFEEFLLAQLNDAKRSATKQNSYRTKHLNQWVGARTSWMNMLAWQRQKMKVTVADCAGMRCWISVDLATKIDVAALCMLFEKPEGGFIHIPKFYVPEAALERNPRYREFHTAGFLSVTPGEATDFEFIEEEIIRLSAQINLQDICGDDWQAAYLMNNLSKRKLPVINFNQTVKNMSEPMKQIEAEVRSKTIWHDNNLVMNWMMSNVSARIDAKENIYPRKENDNDPLCKIDGVVAMIMARGRAMQAEPVKKTYQMFVV